MSKKKKTSISIPSCFAASLLCSLSLSLSFTRLSSILYESKIRHCKCHAIHPPNSSTRKLQLKNRFLRPCNWRRTMADRRAEGFFKGEVLTYAYLLLYIALSSGQIFFNKVILSFPFALVDCLFLFFLVFACTCCFDYFSSNLS